MLVTSFYSRSTALVQTTKLQRHPGSLKYTKMLKKHALTMTHNISRHVALLWKWDWKIVNWISSGSSNSPRWHGSRKWGHPWIWSPEKQTLFYINGPWPPFPQNRSSAYARFYATLRLYACMIYPSFKHLILH